MRFLCFSYGKNGLGSLKMEETILSNCALASHQSPRTADLGGFPHQHPLSCCRSHLAFCENVLWPPLVWGPGKCLLILPSGFCSYPRSLLPDAISV